jgi:hypothetical protein
LHDDRRNKPVRSCARIKTAVRTPIVLGRLQFEKTVEGICGWIPHEQVEGQSAFTN